MRPPTWPWRSARRPAYADVSVDLGGLGLFGNGSGGFYIPNAFQLGLEYPFRAWGAFCNASIALRYTSSATSGYDPMLALYAGRSFLSGKLLVANSLEAWTTSGKLASWKLESEAWYKVAKDLSVGTYVRSTRNVYALSNRWLVYPSFGVRYAF